MSLGSMDQWDWSSDNLRLYSSDHFSVVKPFISDAMEVWAALSGETVAVLDEVVGKSVQEVKQLLAAQLGISRFRQSLLAEGGLELQDHEVLAAPMNLYLLIREVLRPDARKVKQMILASRVNNSVALEHLLQCASDPNVTDDRGRRPLDCAVQSGHLNAVRLLLEARAEKEIRTDGFTPLGVAAARGRTHLEIVRLLVEAGADKESLQCDGQTPLGIAIANGCFFTVRLLLEARADTDHVQNDGQTALGIAISRRDLEMSRLLIEARADTDKTRNCFGIVGASGRFEIALDGSHSVAVELLLQCRVDPNVRVDRGREPLYRSVQSGHLALVRLLLEAGADTEIKRDGLTPLGVAATRGHLDIATLLIEAGADKEASQFDGQTPLGIAAAKGHLEVVRLLQAGADMEHARDDGFIPGELAVASGHVEIARVLDLAGAQNHGLSMADGQRRSESKSEKRKHIELSSN